VVIKVSVGKSQLLLEAERVQFKKSSFELAIENWAEFWRWQSKVMARNKLECAKKTSCVI
jgi:hypothetical protein